jgi:hypothetical protein
MAEYPPPTEDLPIFDNNVFVKLDEFVTIDHINNNFLKFPIAQGAETLTDVTVLGTSTFNGTETHNNIVTFQDNITLTKNIKINAIPASPVITLTDGTTTNTLTQADWTGNIKTVNSTQNSTHFLNFSDLSTTGQGHPQKNASLSCNPSTGLLTATTFSGSLSGNASSASAISLTSDNTAGAYFIPFSKTVSSTSSLFVDNSVTPLSYDPSTSRLACNEFSGDLLGNATSSTFVNTTNDNTNTTYNLVFCNGASTNASLLIDSVTGPLTYNPSSGDISTASVTAVTLNASTVNAELRYGSGSSPAATFAGTTLTVNLNSVSIRMNTIIFTGGANTVTTLIATGPRNNGIYYVGIRNNGTAGTSFLTGLAANTLTKYSSTVVVPASSSALMSINIITINAVQTIVVGIDLLT